MCERVRLAHRLPVIGGAHANTGAGIYASGTLLRDPAARMAADGYRQPA
ncbi:MAG: hypothetical protein WBN81_01765 [Gammaproteobacteria bacterium]